MGQGCGFKQTSSRDREKQTSSRAKEWARAVASNVLGIGCGSARSIYLSNSVLFFVSCLIEDTRCFTYVHR